MYTSHSQRRIHAPPRLSSQTMPSHAALQRHTTLGGRNALRFTIDLCVYDCAFIKCRLPPSRSSLHRARHNVSVRPQHPPLTSGRSFPVRVPCASLRRALSRPAVQTQWNPTRSTDHIKRAALRAPICALRFLCESVLALALHASLPDRTLPWLVHLCGTARSVCESEGRCICMREPVGAWEEGSRGRIRLELCAVGGVHQETRRIGRHRSNQAASCVRRTSVTGGFWRAKPYRLSWRIS